MAQNNVDHYPANVSVDYPDRLDRLTTFFRIFLVIPIGIIVALLSGEMRTEGGREYDAVGILFLPVVLMVLFRQKYPRWWFDWNLALTRFSARVAAYVALLRDEYPSTDEEQAVHLDIPYPDARTDLNRWLPLVKWFWPSPTTSFLCF